MPRGPRGPTGPARAAALWAVLAAGALACADAPVARDGQLSLRSWDFAQDGAVALAGEWQVCWDAFVPPDAEACPTGPWQPFEVPGLWSDRGRDSPIGGRGIASYRLRVELPEQSGPLALRAGAPMTAHALWIDGRARGGSGRPGETAARTEARLENRSYELDAARELELLVHVANFEFRGGGLRREWLLGEADTIESRVARALLRDGILASSALIVALFFAAQWALRPSERARGWFALCALVIGLRALAASVTNLTDVVLPWASFEWQIRLEYLGNALLLAVAPGYFRSKVPGLLPPRLTQGLQISGLALVPFVLFGSFPTALATLSVAMLMAPLVLGTVLVSYGRAWRLGIPGVHATLVATALWLAVVLHDIFRVETGQGASIELFPFFIPVWIGIEAHSMLRGYAHSYATVEKLSHELQELNHELQETEESVVRFVPLDLLRLLGRKTFRDIRPGDHAELDVPVLSCSLAIDETSPRQGFARLEGLVERLGGIIRAHEGLLVQQLGPELVACFPTGADAAVEAALEMQRSLRRDGDADPGPGCAIGIANGPLVLGTAGSSRRLVSLASGPGLDAARAIRDEAAGSRAGPWIAGRTCEQLTGPWALRSCDGIGPEGEPGPLFEVLGRGPDPS